MDNNLLIPIVALILGLIFGWILARLTGRGGINELDAKLRQTQAAADGAKRDFTNLQSELNIKQTHINTLNSNIGILEEKLRLAEAGGAAGTATIARLQGELKTASVDKPAFEAELREQSAELARVRQQVQAQQDEAVDLWRQLQAAEAATADANTQLEAFEAENARREALRLVALFEGAQLASLQHELEQPAEESEVVEKQSLVADEVLATPKPAADPDVLDEANKQIFDLKDGIATLAFAGAELAGAYEKRNREYEELHARVRTASPTVPAAAKTTLAPEREEVEAPQEGLRPAAKMGLAAGGVALAKGISDEHHEKAAAAEAEAEAGPSAEELNEQIEALKKQYAALQADLQTETKSKADLTTEIQARVSELGGLKETLASVDTNLDELIGPRPMPTDEAQATLATTTDGTAQGPLGAVAKLALVKTMVDGLKSTKGELEGKLQTTDVELGDVNTKLAALTTDADALKAQLADATADIDALIGPLPTPAEVAERAQPLDLKAKIGLVRDNITDLSSKRSELESRLQAGGIELGALRKKLLSLDGVLSGILGVQAQRMEAAGNGQPATEATATTTEAK